MPVVARLAQPWYTLAPIRKGSLINALLLLDTYARQHLDAEYEESDVAGIVARAIVKAQARSRKTVRHTVSLPGQQHYKDHNGDIVH